MNKRFCSILVLWMLGLTVLLTGCGRELQQRQVFINFLQKEVIPRSSGILTPTTAVRKKLGIYASHYDVIVEYNNVVLEKVFKPLEKSQREYQDAMKPEATVQERRKAIIKYREALRPIEATFDKVFAMTDAEIAKLNQPNDLKEVYIQAVEKHVRIPAKTLKVMIPATEEMLDKNLDLLDYITANKSKVEIKEGKVQVDMHKDKDQSTRIHLIEKQAEILKIAQTIQALHSELTRQSIGK